MSSFDYNQFLIEGMISRGSSPLERLRQRLFSHLRSLRLRSCDPFVKYDLEGTPVQVPLSHDLPLYREIYPLYGRNLVTVAAQMAKAYDDLAIIDIGANVGDSALMVRKHIEAPILCVEGVDRYFDCLTFNTRQSPNIETERTFVVGREDQLLSVVVERGTARLIMSGCADQTLPTATLSQVIARHPKFHSAKLWKIDADGFDCKIIREESVLLAEKKPVLFFEYDPTLAENAGCIAFDIFEVLEKSGYDRLLVYQNSGEYMFGTEVSNRTLLNDLDHYFQVKRGYCDLVAFHAVDAHIAEEVRAAELGGVD